jgi:hypothetical protein
VDFEHSRKAEKMRFMAHLTQSAGNPKHVELMIERAIAELESFCSSPLLEPHWPTEAGLSRRSRERPLSAIVHGMNTDQIGDFWGGWTLIQVALRPGFIPADFWLREHAETPF